MNPYDEPLEISAPIAWDLAAQYCRPDPETGTTCAWNHGLWQILRLMGLASSASNRSAFYVDEILRFGQDRKKLRVLISGASDYAMLAQVLHAGKKIHAELSITVLDICETPLQLNRWYADRAGMPIQTLQTNFLDYSDTNAFDLICTDSFLGRFPHSQWPDVAAHWKTLLRPDGQLLTASRLRSPETPARMAFSSDQAAAFVNTIHSKMPALRLQEHISTMQLEQAAKQYGRLQHNYPLRSTEELQALFEKSGLLIESMAPSRHPVTNAPGIQAPSISGGGIFLQIVAKHS